MSRLHFYVMGLIALAYALLSLAEFVFATYGLPVGWLDLYPAAQLAWLETLPRWVTILWGVHVAFALFGALCLLAHIQAAVWMLAFAFMTLIALYVWMLGIAQPSMVEIVGGGATLWVALALVMALSFLIYIYARQEKRTGEVL